MAEKTEGVKDRAKEPKGCLLVTARGRHGLEEPLAAELSLPGHASKTLTPEVRVGRLRELLNAR